MTSRVLHLIGGNCIGGPEKQILHHAVLMQDSAYQTEFGSSHDTSLASTPRQFRRKDC